MVKKLRLVCLVKIVPDVDQFTYDYEKHILNRESGKCIINPDDACAVAAALRLKEVYNAEVMVISMGPESARRHLEDLIRRGVDEAVLISDSLYRGSDTYATSKILSRCIQRCGYDIVLSGTHSLDGDTAHVPCQIAELLDINVMTNIVKIRDDKVTDQEIQFEVVMDDKNLELVMNWPAVMGISAESKYRLPFVKYEDIKKDVSDRFRIMTNEMLNFDGSEVGIEGSKTKVIGTYPKPYGNKEKVVVHNDDAGIEYIYQFLKEKGFV